MSLRIALADPPDFYTNLDVITGHVVLHLPRPELVGAIVVKLEGESRTALAAPFSGDPRYQSGGPGGRLPGSYPGSSGGGGLHSNAQSGNIVSENHKILYRVSQVFPQVGTPAHAAPVNLAPGQHAFPFSFKLPFNNACADSAAMARIGGLAGAGGYGLPGPAGIFGSGIRVMDGSRQLMYRHVTRTLPPSFTGFPGRAEIRYYVKVTVQRPGLLRENWRQHLGFKFLPIEPPRPQNQEKQADGKNREAYARRPFTFQERSPTPIPEKKKSSLFTRKESTSLAVPSPTAGPSNGAGSGSSSSTANNPQTLQDGLPPSIEMSARLPHPAILTCNQPIPLRLIARKLVPSREVVHLVSLQVDLVGSTHLRCQELHAAEQTRWVVVSRSNLALPLCGPDDPVGHEAALPDSLWRAAPLPNTVMPSFVACNLDREYSLELRLGLSWGLPPQQQQSSSMFGKGKQPAVQPQAIFLPRTFSSVEVYSGVTPPPELVARMQQQQQQQQQQRPPRPRPQQPQPQPQQYQHVPPLPPRTNTAGPQAAHDTLYPPQLRPGQEVPPYDDAPPSYDEAMAEELTGPILPPGQARPAYSGVTNENAPSTIPEKN